MKRRPWRSIAVTAMIVIIVVVVAIGIWQARTCEAIANECISNPVMSGESNRPAPPVEAIQACRESQGYFCRILAPANIPNILLVLAGFLGIFAAFRTLKILKRQTQATEDAAEAAKASADTFIASERGFLKADLVREASKFGGHWFKTEPYKVALTSDELKDGLYYRYELRVTNIGRTPVQVIGIEHRYTYLGKDVTELPPGVANDVLAIAEERTISAGEAANIGFLKIDVQMSSHWDEINSLVSTAVFHGWVKYLALIDPSSESFADYCYVYSPSQEVLVRRDQYNTNRHSKKQQKAN